MKKILQISILALLLVTYFLVGLSYAACIGPSLSAVQTAVTNAARGSTVEVCAGSASWNAELVITKSISLIGAGAGSTVITSTQTATSCTTNCNYMISYVPSSISDDANTLMRISGFTLDADFKAGHIEIYNNSTTPHTKVRIDNNALVDGYYPTAASQTDRNSVMIRGMVYGVMDNNTMSGAPTLRIYGPGSGKVPWYDYTWYPGTPNAFYFEDNTVTYDYPSHTDWERNLDSTGWGASWVVRYNDYVADPASSALIMIWDSHQGMDSMGTYATRGKEAYGNDFTGMGRFVARCNGGQSLMFFNRDNDTNATYRPYGNMSYLGANETGLYTCGSNAIEAERERASCAAAVGGYTQPQHPHRNYDWANWWGSTPTAWQGFVESGSSVLRLNTDYFNYNTSFNGSSGTGCGTLANRPTTCTTGVVYFATDLNCGSIGNYVGVSPATPITGTLYRCALTNTWQEYYTPYTYPHPLRDDVPEDTTAPGMSNFQPVTEQVCTDAEGPPYTQDVAISLTATDQTQASVVCKWDTSVDEDPVYAELSNTFDVSGTTFYDTATLSCATGTSIYYACTDGTNTTTVNNSLVSVGNPEDSTGPVLTNNTPSSQSCCSVLLDVSTDEPSTCRYCAYDGDDCDSDTLWVDRTSFQVTGGDTTHHSSAVSQAASTAQKYEILCQDTQENESSNLELTVTTDAAKSIGAIGLGTGDLTISIGSGTLNINIIP